MRIFNMLTLGLLLSFAMVSVASAHCGSCGTKKEKAHTHDKKDGKHEHKKKTKMQMAKLKLKKSRVMTAKQKHLLKRK